MANFIVETVDGESSTLEGYIKIAGTDITANLDLESDTDSTPKIEGVEDFRALINMVQDLSEYLTEEKLHELKQSVSKEISDAAYEQDGDPSDEDYQKLTNDLNLVDVYVFDEGFVLTFSSEEIFPDSDIIVQLNADYSIDDIAVYGSDEFDEE